LGSRSSTLVETPTLTNVATPLCALLEKTYPSLPHDMVGFTAQRLMELESESLTDAPYRPCSKDRINQLSGSCAADGNPRRHHWAAGAQAAPQVAPANAGGSYFPAFLKPCPLAETGLTAVVQEAHVQGVCTCSGDYLV
jgi:hypothetical protein